MFVVDASVALKYALNEPGSNAAEAILLGREYLAVPHFFYLEIAHVLWRSVQRKRLLASAFEISFAAIKDLPLEIVPDGTLMGPAVDLALRHEIAVYDALYVALAQSKLANLATSDDALCAKLRRAKLPNLRYTQI